MIHTLSGHLDEVLDLNFNLMGSKLVSASADRTARVYNVTTGNCISVLHGIKYIINLNIKNSIIKFNLKIFYIFFIIYNYKFLKYIIGHDGEVSKANFNS